MSEQERISEVTAVLESMQVQNSMLKMIEGLDKSLSEHMKREEENQKKFIELLNDMKTSITHLEHAISTERLTSDSQLQQCKTSLRNDLTREQKENMKSLKVELLNAINEIKRPLEERRQDVIKIYDRLEKVESKQAVYGEYIELLKKVLMTGAVVIVAAIFAAIGLQK